MILVLNCGSQIIKWKVFDKDLKAVKEGHRTVLNQENFKEALQEEMEKVRGMEIYLVGHRVVHGKDIFREPLEINVKNLKQLETLNHLAPLHNPYNVLGIKTCQDIFKNVTQIAVFDTEFFKDLPQVAYTYALPEKIVKEFGFRRYGFHGISHEYVALKAAEAMKKPLSKLKIISCHLGGGSSVAAIKNGKAVDTSMGFTPAQGLVMMTRAGDIGSGITLEIARKYNIDKTSDILNKESGIKGICGESDMLKVLKDVEAGDVKAKLAFDVFVYSIKKYIGSYFAILGGCDALIFTGSIGSGAAITRESVCKGLNILNKTKIFAIKTDEELAIAEKIAELIK